MQYGFCPSGITKARPRRKEQEGKDTTPTKEETQRPRHHPGRTKKEQEGRDTTPTKEETKGPDTTQEGPRRSKKEETQHPTKKNQKGQKKHTPPKNNNSSSQPTKNIKKEFEYHPSSSCLACACGVAVSVLTLDAQGFELDSGTCATFKNYSLEGVSRQPSTLEVMNSILARNFLKSCGFPPLCFFVWPCFNDCIGRGSEWDRTTVSSATWLPHASGRGVLTTRPQSRYSNLEEGNTCLQKGKSRSTEKYQKNKKWGKDVLTS